MLANTAPGLNSKSPLLLVEDVHARDVGGQQVRRELDPAERAVDRAGDGLGEHRLAHARARPRSAGGPRRSGATSASRISACLPRTTCSTLASISRNCSANRCQSCGRSRNSTDHLPEQRAHLTPGHVMKVTCPGRSRPAHTIGEGSKFRIEGRMQRPARLADAPRGPCSQLPGIALGPTLVRHEDYTVVIRVRRRPSRRSARRGRLHFRHGTGTRAQRDGRATGGGAGSPRRGAGPEGQGGGRRCPTAWSSTPSMS